VQGDVRDLSRQEHGLFTVVLSIGILYHLDAPDVFTFVERIAERDGNARVELFTQARRSFAGKGAGREGVRSGRNRKKEGDVNRNRPLTYRPRHRRWRGALLLLPLLLVACGGGSGATPRAAGNTPGTDTPLTTALPVTTRAIDKVDQVFLQLLVVYQTQGLDGAKQFARDQGLMTTTDEVRVTLVLDSDDPAIVDGTALAAGRLGGRVTATYGDQIELVVPVRTAMEYGNQANRQSFFADLADFAHVRDIRRTPLAQPMTAPISISNLSRR
jgi:hypothetical protein